MKGIEKIKAHKLEGTVLTSWYFYDEGVTGLNIGGDFGTDEAAISDYKHYDVYFCRIQGEIAGRVEEGMSGSVLQRIQVSKEDLYQVSLEISGAGRIQFLCEDVHCALKRYRGVSYKNVYETKEYQDLFEKSR